jgi:DNA-binding response OmpR family regulator
MKKILYVEDNIDIAESVKLILGSLGYDVKIALTGKRGLEMTREDLFDLVIFDVMLPDMSGIEVFEIVRKYHEEERHSCGYVFLSILSFSNDKKEELSRKGVGDYISKPFCKDDLVMRVANVLSG